MMYQGFTKIFTLLVLFLFVGQATNQAAPLWQTVGNNRQANISGMALVENNEQLTTFIIVHDNKKKKETRAGIITTTETNTPRYQPLAWIGELPVDLEAITVIADQPNHFMALTSAGKFFHIELNRTNNSVRVIKSFAPPSLPTDSNFEGFTLQKLGDSYLAVWAERGENTKPGTLFWSRFDLKTYTFDEIRSASITVPFPNANVRHISDLKLDPAGQLFISSAADPGDDGPFSSAVYLAGTFDVSQPVIALKQTPLSQIFSVDSRKIEAFEILPGEKNKMAFGTDDENQGSAIYNGWSLSVFSASKN